MPGDDFDGALEADAGLDRDRQQVEDVGQIPPDRALPLVLLAAQPGDGGEDAHAGQDHHHADQPEAVVARGLGDEQAEQDAGAEADALHDHELLRPDLGRHAGHEEAVAELVGPPAGDEHRDLLADGTGQRPQQPGDDRILQAGGELVEDGGLGVQFGQHRLGVHLRRPQGVGHQHGADGGGGETQGEQHRRPHQISILTMRMIIPIPTPTETAAPIRMKRPGVRSSGSR